MAALPIIGLTLGDAAGVGPEVVRAALASDELDDAFEYKIIGSVPDCSPGRPTDQTARAGWDALEEAARLANAGQIAAVVTGPIQKAAMRAVGFPFPGQTEFFAARCKVENFAMCLTGGGLTVGLVTAHVALRDVSKLLRRDEITRVGALLAEFTREKEGKLGSIAVAGLNPHAGEEGMFGREEIDVIAPAVAELNDIYGKRDLFRGPISPDTVFHRAVAGEFQAVLCMYHDQGLIPLKLHAFDEGVNVTLGLPIIRTSPDHGTAFEIAGRGLARPASTVAAIRLATRLVRARNIRPSSAIS